MRILIINTLYSPYRIGGAELSVQILAEGLVKSGHTVRVLTLHEFNYTKRDVINGVEVCYIPLKNIYWPFFEKSNSSKILKLFWHLIDNYNPFMKKYVAFEIEDFNPDVVHTNNLVGFSVSVWDVVAKYKIRLIHTARDYYLFHPNNTLFKNNKQQNVRSVSIKFWSYIKRIKSRKVDYFVGISKFIKNFYLENNFFDIKNSDYIYNPVERIYKEKINKSPKNIGFIGRLTVDKGFDTFCDLAKRYPEYNFVAAGRFSETEKNFFKNKAENSNVKILGFVNIIDFIALVDIVILPIKWNEPFGRVVVECALAEILVYTNRKGGVSELFDYFENLRDISEFPNLNNENYNGNNKWLYDCETIVNLYFNVYGLKQ
ncbi:glycosyltransferase family 4 protein [uncultured Acinetobacter sp.]|uniref:glycosyltransferase family 4 protein n=1 Tax=uncultured Acinetobacter sp. TaxID=165433 RepID=UPI0025910983|nr:glycosyltransferase family 4 protein [uncultured Acinetobacter sp.]